MHYIEGFVAAVPTANKQAYTEHAKRAAELFKQFGALKVVESWGDDIPEGELTSFPMAVKCKPDETVVFSWVVWSSHQAREEGIDKMMSDPLVKAEMSNMPFDGQRLIYGGFEVIVDV